ncbi:host attachment protein [Roseospira goensis]|uniref:Protein required for attachment to host cells n=1 Tax=Roseospira goensis TaxID=391922 RepID=A0A7W6WM58_9PROT|nr:host attachment protein [Roseospira goensis]MBB4287162.1 protein required for attachment to host cells [Roseospira goensis]
MSTSTTWVLVADATRARVFEATGQPLDLARTPVHEMTAADPPSRDIASDRPGRTFESVGDLRHAKEPPTDPHRHEKRRFAHAIAGLLERGRTTAAFDRLVIVAPPQMLGDLRDELSDPLRGLVIAEVDKDLSMLPPHDLAPHLAALMAR